MSDLKIISLDKEKVSLEKLASKLFLISKEVYRYNYSWLETDFFWNLKSKPNQCLLLIEGSEPVGFLTYSYLLGVAEISNFSISPRYQSNGWGKKMLATLIEQARGSQAKQIFLDVREHNDRARHLYESVGFVELSRRKDYYVRPKDDALVLVLDVEKLRSKTSYD